MKRPRLVLPLTAINFAALDFAVCAKKFDKVAHFLARLSRSRSAQLIFLSFAYRKEYTQKNARNTPLNYIFALPIIFSVRKMTGHQCCDKRFEIVYFAYKHERCFSRG